MDISVMGTRFQEISLFCIEFYANRCEDGYENLGFQYTAQLNNISHLIETQTLLLYNYIPRLYTRKMVRNSFILRL